MRYITDGQLQRLMQQPRSDELWQAIYRIAHGIICRYFNYVRDREDLVQVAVERCWEKLEEYDPRRGSPFSFISGLCRNAIYEQLRQPAR